MWDMHDDKSGSVPYTTSYGVKTSAQIPDMSQFRKNQAVLIPSAKMLWLPFDFEAFIIVRACKEVYGLTFRRVYFIQGNKQS